MAKHITGKRLTHLLTLRKVSEHRTGKKADSSFIFDKICKDEILSGRLFAGIDKADYADDNHRYAQPLPH